jgi:tripartite-type tricarboxylate transporter receptor subunit TctC
MFASFAPVVRLVASLLAASYFGLAPAEADELAPLKDRTIRIIASGGPGSNSDVYARAFADGLKEVVPEASIGVQSLTGAAGSAALKELVESKGNLLTLAVFGGGALFNQILGTETLDFDLNAIQWIGVFGDARRVLALRKGFGTSFEALRTSDVQPLLPVSNPRALQALEGRLINAISGARIRIGTGFDLAQRNMMILSGDGDLLLQQYGDLIPFFESGDVVPVLRYARDGYPPELDGVPTLAEVAAPGTAPEILDLMLTFNELSQFIGTSPAVSTSDIDALRAAFDKVVALPSYGEKLQSQRQTNRPTSGADVAVRIGKLLDQSDKTKQIFKAALDCGERIGQGEIKSCQ